MTPNVEYSVAPPPVPERRLIDFQPGERFENALFAVSDCRERPARSGVPYLAFKLRDCTGERHARWFSPPAGAAQQLANTRFARMWGRVDLNPAYRGDFKIEACEAAATPADLTPFLPPLPRDHAAHRARFNEIALAVKSTPLRALLKEIFRRDGELWPRFETAPAARSLHHAHRGGLLEHTGEVALLCERVASTLPHLDRDLLLTAALLHDIGKLEEMESDLAAGEYTAAGHLVGHVVLGTCTIAGAIENIEDFPLALKHELMHLILSHHGRLEYGAAKMPMCAEAVVLSLCDLMSAKVAQCREKIDGGATGDFLSKQDAYGWESEKIYLGAMRRMLEASSEESF